MAFSLARRSSAGSVARGATVAYTSRMPAPPRVAYFPDSFHEINGVAHTSRHFQAFARSHDLPFLCVRAGDRSRDLVTDGSITTLELSRSRVSVPLDRGLNFDPLYFRHWNRIRAAVEAFKPDIIHITGPSELGILGATLARRLRVPLAASWHTNLHEYAGRRATGLLRWLPRRTSDSAETNIERASLWLTTRFYRLAKLHFAPNQELCDLLERMTGRPCALMQRGVDTDLFSPAHRTRDEAGDGEFLLGFVGRLSVEKNVAMLAQIAKELREAGIARGKFFIVGQGEEEQWLRQRMPDAIFAGVLRGADLSRAYANMDLFVFPSHTDTFGNVVLEALASGVPAVVTPDGGPKYIVRHHETGFITGDAGFTSAVTQAIHDKPLYAAMKVAARQQALSSSWDGVFERVYAAYETISAARFRIVTNSTSQN